MHFLVGEASPLCPSNKKQSEKGCSEDAATTMKCVFLVGEASPLCPLLRLTANLAEASPKTDISRMTIYAPNLYFYKYNLYLYTHNLGLYKYKLGA